jgi:hypothetical protein
MLVAERIICAIDSIRSVSPQADIVLTGDFNDLHNGATLELLCQHQMVNISREARGSHGAQGTYKHEGKWGSLDHILVSEGISKRTHDTYIQDAPFLLEDDEKYGGVKPKRTYIGYRYHRGYSDHLPLVARWKQPPSQEE